MLTAPKEQRPPGRVRAGVTVLADVVDAAIANGNGTEGVALGIRPLPPPQCHAGGRFPALLLGRLRSLGMHFPSLIDS